MTWAGKSSRIIQAVHQLEGWNHELPNSSPLATTASRKCALFPVICNPITEPGRVRKIELESGHHSVNSEHSSSDDFGLKSEAFACRGSATVLETVSTRSVAVEVTPVSNRCWLDESAKCCHAFNANQLALSLVGSAFYSVLIC